ncbi:MAG: DUF5615 family PIN-like protein [Nitrospirota bacterium]
MAKLKIYTDENVDIRIASGLRKRGVEAFSANEKEMVGASDIEHFRYANNLKSVIFTHDHHFLEIANSLTQEGEGHWGVIFVEMNRLSVGECIRRLSLYADVLLAEEMINSDRVFMSPILNKNHRRIVERYKFRVLNELKEKAFK